MSALTGVLFLCRSSGFAEFLPSGPGPLVLVSVSPQAYFVKALGGDLVRTEIMIPASANHETYEPNIRQLKALSEARTYVKVGHTHFSFETGWIDLLLNENKKLFVVNGSEGVTLKPDDSHYWVSPKSGAAIAKNISRALVGLLPDKKEAIDGRLSSLLAEIERLDADISTLLAPYRGRQFIVFHPAWGYFADDYGLKQIAIESEGKEPNMQGLARLIEDARRWGVRAIYVEPSLSSKSAEIVAEAVGAKVVVLNPMEEDWANNLRQTARILAENFKRELTSK